MDHPHELPGPVQPRRYAAVVAASENDIIGRSGGMPWRMSGDLKRFKAITMGHHLIMGRKTLESIGRILPGRTTIVITRNKGFEFPGAMVAGSKEEVDQITRQDSLPMVVGGGEIYRMFWPFVAELFLTRIHTHIEGDTSMPAIDPSVWSQIVTEDFPADERNEFASTFTRFRRR